MTQRAQNVSLTRIATFLFIVSTALTLTLWRVFRAVGPSPRADDAYALGGVALLGLALLALGSAAFLIVRLAVLVLRRLKRTSD
jgi:NADH:ubiquinone oxidoreductase subunit H